MTKEEAKLKLIMILSSKDTRIEYAIFTHRKYIELNNQTLFFLSSSSEMVRISDDLRATYKFHNDLRDMLGVLDYEEVSNIVKDVEELEEVN